MNKSLKDFLLLSLLTIIILLLAVAGLSYLYRYSSVNAYEFALIIIIILIIIIASVLAISTAAVIHAYNSKKVGRSIGRLYKLCLKLLLPFIMFLAGAIKYGKDEIRRFYIEVNNIIVESENRRYKPEQVLVLLPHCLQHSSCEYKITNDIKNCKKCGRCCIGEMLEIAEAKRVKVVVATGGTLARNVIAVTKPEFILSVACERDLTSGISDVGSLSVVGIINERPMGPCHNTTVNVARLREKLDRILENNEYDS